MTNNKIEILFKTLRLAFFFGQIVLIFAGAYLKIVDNDLFFYPIILLLIQQIIYWLAYVYFEKKPVDNL